MENPQGAAISPSLRTLTRVPYTSGDTATPLLFLVQSEKCTTDRGEIEKSPRVEGLQVRKTRPRAVKLPIRPAIPPPTTSPTA